MSVGAAATFAVGLALAASLPALGGAGTAAACAAAPRWQLLFLVVLAGLARTPAFPAAAAAFAAWLYLAPRLVERVMKLPLAPSADSLAVGFTTWSGFAKSLDFWAFAASILLAAALSVIAGFTARVVLRGRSAEASTEDAAPRLSPLALRIAGALVILALSANLFPPIVETFAALPTMKPADDWDSQALLAWSYLLTVGARPFRDFWCPYAGLIDEQQPFPWGMTKLFFHLALIVGVLAISVYRLARGRVFWPVVVTAGIVVAKDAGLLPGMDRYFLALATVLGFAALRTGPASRPWHAAYGLFLVWVVAYEPNQLIYAAPAVLLMLGLEWASAGREAKPLIVRGVATIGAVAFVGCASYGLQLWYLGELPGFIDFYRSMGTQASRSSWPAANISNWFRVDLCNGDAVLMLEVHALLILGIVWLLQRDAHVMNGGRISAALALMAIMMVQKHLVRPHMAWQLIGLLFVALLVLTAVWAARWSRMQVMVVGLLMGLLVRQDWGVIVSVAQRVRAVPARARAGVGTLILPAEKIDWARREYFSRRRYEADPVVREVIRFLDENATRGKGERLFVLGDEAAFYIAMGQTKLPPYLSFYDGSHLNAQHAVVDWISRNTPEFVLWNPKRSVFDHVPNIVRVPLLFKAVIEGFEPVMAIGPYQILSRRDRSRPLDLAFWRRQLGPEVDLGDLAAHSAAVTAPACENDSSTCADILEITAPPVQTKTQRIIDVQGGAETYQLKVSQPPGTTRMAVYLENVWFWNAMKRNYATTPTPRCLSEGCQAKLSSHDLPREIVF